MRSNTPAITNQVIRLGGRQWTKALKFVGYEADSGRIKQSEMGMEMEMVYYIYTVKHLRLES